VKNGPEKAVDNSVNTWRANAPHASIARGAAIHAALQHPANH
jgi:hypothetical protein